MQRKETLKPLRSWLAEKGWEATPLKMESHAPNWSSQFGLEPWDFVILGKFLAGHSNETQFPHSGWCDVLALPHLVEIKDSDRKIKQTNKEKRYEGLRCSHLRLSEWEGHHPALLNGRHPQLRGTTGQAERPHQPLFILEGNVKTYCCENNFLEKF